MSRKLRFWKGRILHIHNPNDPNWDESADNAGMAYICAHSRLDANRLIAEYTGKEPPANELKVYFDEGNWGSAMKAHAPERGIWIAFGPTSARKEPIRML